MRDEALADIVLETLRQYIRDVVDLDDILAMTDTAPLRTAEAQKVQRQLDKKRSEYERLQKLLMSLYENLADGIIDRDEYARLNTDLNDTESLPFTSFRGSQKRESKRNDAERRSQYRELARRIPTTSQAAPRRISRRMF